MESGRWILFSIYLISSNSKTVSWDSGFRRNYFFFLPKSKISNFIPSILGAGFPGGSGVKNLPAKAEDIGSNSNSERSPSEGHGNPILYSCLGNPMDREAWWVTVCGITKSQTNWVTKQQQQHPWAIFTIIIFVMYKEFNQLNGRRASPDVTSEHCPEYLTKGGMCIWSLLLSAIT